MYSKYFSSKMQKFQHLSYFGIFLVSNIISVSAGAEATPTDTYVSYINQSRLIIITFLIPLLLTITYISISAIFNKYQIKATKNKKILTAFSVTLLSFILFYSTYLAELPFISSVFPQRLSLTTFLIFGNPLNYLAAFFAVVFSKYLLKLIVKSEQKPKVVVLIAGLMILGIFITPLLTYIFLNVFPYTGRMWV